MGSTKAYFFDAGTNPPRKRVINVDGERRIEKIPNGHVERYVDGKGNVVWEQLVSSGLPATTEAVDRARALVRRRDGRWIEHGRCPLSQGTLKPADFPEEMKTLCDEGTYGPGRACPHVEYTIEKRQAENAAAREVRHFEMNRAVREKEAREAAQLAQQERLNANLEKIVEGAVAGGKAKGKAQDKAGE